MANNNINKNTERDNWKKSYQKIFDELIKMRNDYQQKDKIKTKKLNKLRKELKELEKVITEVLLEHRQLTKWEFMQKLFDDNSTWTENNKFLTDELVKEIKNGNHSDIIIKIVEYWKEEDEKDALDAKVHYDSLQLAENWRKRQLTEIVGEKLILLDKSDIKFKRQEARTRELEKLLEESEAEKSKLLEKQVSEIKKWESRERELQRQLDLATRPSPKLPSKFKIFKENIKTGLQKLVKREKHQKRELVAKIEVPTK